MPGVLGGSPAIQSADDITSDEVRIHIDVKVRPGVTDPDSRNLFAYCDTCLAAGSPPRRSELPAREIVALLPNIFMLEPVDARGADWRFRLMGQGIVSRFGGDATDLTISQLYDPAQVEHNARIYREVSIGDTPNVTHGTFQGIDKEYLEFEIVHLPLIGTDGDTRWILGGIFFDGTHLTTS
ncbi:MAG: PAS domain-containing protein [Candidatus Phaeomarinobacter sp.]